MSARPKQLSDDLSVKCLPPGLQNFTGRAKSTALEGFSEEQSVSSEKVHQPSAQDASAHPPLGLPLIQEGAP